MSISGETFISSVTLYGIMSSISWRLGGGAGLAVLLNCASPTGQSPDADLESRNRTTESEGQVPDSRLDAAGSIFSKSSYDPTVGTARLDVRLRDGRQIAIESPFAYGSPADHALQLDEDISYHFTGVLRVDGRGRPIFVRPISDQHQGQYPIYEVVTVRTRDVFPNHFEVERNSLDAYGSNTAEAREFGNGEYHRVVLRLGTPEAEVTVLTRESPFDMGRVRVIADKTERVDKLGQPIYMATRLVELPPAEVYR